MPEPNDLSSNPTAEHSSISNATPPLQLPTARLPRWHFSRVDTGLPQVLGAAFVPASAAAVASQSKPRLWTPPSETTKKRIKKRGE